MRLVLEDFYYKGEHHDRYDVEIVGIDVDDFIKMGKLRQMEIYNRVKDQLKSDFGD